MVRKLNKCHCFEARKIKRQFLNMLTGTVENYTDYEYICNGTKERDFCSCSGDRRYCNFYPEVREKAINEERKLIISFDCNTQDEAALVVSKEENSKIKFLKIFRDEEAKRILTSGLTPDQWTRANIQQFLIY